MNTLSPRTQENKLYTIYALLDPRNSSERYIGQTSNVYERFKEHSHAKRHTER